MKKITIIILALIVIGGGAYFLSQNSTYDSNQPSQENGADSTPADVSPTENGDQSNQDTQDENGDVAQQQQGKSVIGQSSEGRDITAHHYGTGETEILFIGGIHAGYSWNTPLLAYRATEYFEANKETIPEGVKVTVIPVLNPDGLEKVVGASGRFDVSDIPSVVEETIPGRFNGNGVDLNRNFDCEWQEEGTWRETTVDGGEEPFSEPESQAIKNYVEKNNPDAAVVWYSAAGGVFSSSCHNGITEETKDLTNTYANASGYTAHEEFDFYEITGDMVNWFAKKDMPAISVLLSNHEDIEWNKNRAGINAILEYYSK